MSVISRTVRKKRKTQKHSTGKLKLKAAHPWKLVGLESEVIFARHTPDR